MKVVDSLAVLFAWTAGALCIWWTGSWLAGIPACAVLTWLYGRFVRARIEQRLTKRQRDYDATPDGRLTRHHG
ncbi:hypothetical protein [Pedococcus sp. P5_B7]